MEIQINKNTTAWQLITDVYKKLPSRNYRDNWQLITEGMEENLPEVKHCAQEIGVRLIEIESE